MNKSISMQRDGLIDCLNRVQDGISHPKQEVSVEGFRGAAGAYFVSCLQQLENGRPVMIVTSDQSRGDLLLEDFKYFFHYMNLQIKPQSFPSWELLPYESLSPLNQISGERLEILNRLKSGEKLFLIVSIEALMQTVVSKHYLQKNVFSIKPNDELEREILEASLADNGFLRSSLVESRCEFSIRGDIVDFFHPGANNPIRIEFFGDTVESIREFDAYTQISINKLEAIDILPVRELCLSKAEIESGLKKIFRRSEELGLEESETNKIKENIENIGFFPGMEFLAPFFFDSRETVFDFLPENTLVVMDEPDTLIEKVQEFEKLIQTEFNNCIENGRITSSPKEFYLTSEEFFAKCEDFHGPLKLSSLKITDSEEDNLEIKQLPQMAGSLDIFTDQMIRWKSEGQKIVIVAPAKGTDSSYT